MHLESVNMRVVKVTYHPLGQTPPLIPLILYHCVAAYAYPISFKAC